MLLHQVSQPGFPTLPAPRASPDPLQRARGGPGPPPQSRAEGRGGAEACPGPGAAPRISPGALPGERRAPAAGCRGDAPLRGAPSSPALRRRQQPRLLKARPRLPRQESGVLRAPMPGCELGGGAGAAWRGAEPAAAPAGRDSARAPAPAGLRAAPAAPPGSAPAVPAGPALARLREAEHQQWRLGPAAAAHRSSARPGSGCSRRGRGEPAGGPVSGGLFISSPLA